jgi:hypothetical protein
MEVPQVAQVVQVAEEVEAPVAMPRLRVLQMVLQQVVLNVVVMVVPHMSVVSVVHQYIMLEAAVVALDVQPQNLTITV